jgi:outer membrane protein OmpA-like peptidoglycan-associated protein
MHEMFRSSPSLLLTALSLWFLTGCSFNPFTTDNEMTGSPIGAVAGGGIGAGGAALLGAPKYVIGLAGLGGASLGYYVTTVNFASGGIVKAGGQVYSVGDYVTIEIPSDAIFDENSADILPEARPALDSAVSVLQHYPNNNIAVSGNTSGYGPRRYELRRSEERARAIAAYLWAHGVSSFKSTDATLPTRKLTYVGYGNNFPIANNIKASGIRTNSRIQITSYPTKNNLDLCKEQRIFANIGAMHEEPLTPTPTPTNTGDAFNGDLLPRYK